MNFNTRQKMIIEACVRRTLCDLLDRERIAIEDFTGCLCNINQGSFGIKNYKFTDTNNWVSCLQDMRDIIAELDPVHKQFCIEMGVEPYYLTEENKNCCVGDVSDNSQVDCSECEDSFVNLLTACIVEDD